jgi:hypothetical protein
MINMVSHLRLLSKQIIQKQKILFTFHKIRFMGHLILGSWVQLHPIFLLRKAVRECWQNIPMTIEH